MPDAPDVSPGRIAMGHALRLGAGLLGCAALLDLAKESFSHGSWHATAGLGHSFGVVVSGYALANERDKWEGSAPDAPRSGHLFFYAWVVFPVLIWLAQLTNLRLAVWPESLLPTLAWVFGAYGGTKVSKGLRTLHADRKRVAEAAPPPTPAPETPDQYWARHALRFGSMLLGAVCLVDCAVDGFTMGEWHFAGQIYAAYYLVLGAYASTRQWDKWTDRYDQDASWGHVYVGAWVALAFALGMAKVLGFAVELPSNLPATLATVVGLWLGGKVVASQRPAPGSNWWGIPAPAVPPARSSDSGVGPPASGGGATHKDEPEAPGDEVPDEKAAERARKRAAVIEACKRRGIFTTLELVQDTGFDRRTVAAIVGWLCNAGMARKLDEERYQWVGGREDKVTYT